MKAEPTIELNVIQNYLRKICNFIKLHHFDLAGERSRKKLFFTQPYLALLSGRTIQKELFLEILLLS